MRQRTSGSTKMGRSRGPQVWHLSCGIKVVSLVAVLGAAMLPTPSSRAGEFLTQAQATPTPTTSPSPTTSPTPLPEPTPTPTPPPTPQISFTAPSTYPGTTTRFVAGSSLRVVMSVDHPYRIEGGIKVEVVGVSGTASLGRAKQVGRGQTYEIVWDLDQGPVPGAEAGPVPDGDYTIRARSGVHGQPSLIVQAEEKIKVQRNDAAAPSTVKKAQWVQITSPRNGGAAGFTVDVNRDLTVSGIASPGAEGVDLFYSTAPAGTLMNVTSGASPSWISTRCAYVDLLGTGTSTQPFTTKCRLQPAHRPEQVTAVAAVTLDCTNLAGCDSGPAAVPARSGTNSVTFSGGDAVRFYSCWGEPCMTLTPHLWRAPVGACQKVVIDASQLDGSKAAGVNVDVQVQGPGIDPSFCDLPTSTERRAPDAGGGEVWRGRAETVIEDPATGENIHHTEAETDLQGRIVLGVKSTVSSFDSIYDQFESGHSVVRAWIDTNDNDTFDEGDGDLNKGDVHWELPGRCTIVGTEGDDVIEIRSHPNKVCALGGDDVIYGLDGAEGHDIIFGGPGNDLIVGRRGNDKLYGGRGNDMIFGNDGDDVIRGGSGRDEIHGGKHVNKINGGPGNDGCSNIPPKKKSQPKSPPPKNCERDRPKKPPKGTPIE